MPQVHRFYIPPGSTQPDEIRLPTHEAHHALRVVRVREGDPVELFDGQGAVLTGNVARTSRREVVIATRDVRTVAPPSPALVLVQAWLVRERLIEELLRYGTVLGVSRFRFFRAERSEKQPRLNEKWQRTAIECCKQCGRNRLPEFEVVDTLENALGGAAGDVLIADMRNPPVPLANAVSGGDATVLVGPEGDFTGAERALAQRLGAKPISMGATIFRAEMAATVLLSLVRHHQGALGPKAD